MIVIGVLAIVAIGLDVRVVRSMWPSGEGVTAASVLVARVPWCAIRRGDLVAWKLEGAAAPVVAVDRVLALPGEVLRVRDGIAITFGGGCPCQVTPVLGVKHDWACDVRIGAREWGIIASTVNWRPTGPDPLWAQAQAIADGARVRTNQIFGRVLLIRGKGRMWTVP